MDLYKKIDFYKIAIDKLRPFEGDLFTQIKNYFRISLTWSSNALEGNTLTEVETKVLLEDGLTVGGKTLLEIFETLGHANAYDLMFTLLSRHKITEADTLAMHRALYKNIDGKAAGRYRDRPATIIGSQYPACLPDEMKNLFSWAVNERDHYHPVLFAAQLHKRLVFIHPFADGNGRLARLLMNAVLIQDGYMLAVIPPKLRQEYVSLLEQAHRDDRPFMAFIAERVLDSEREMIRLLHIPHPSVDEHGQDQKGHTRPED